MSRLISPFLFTVSRVDVASTQAPPAGTTLSSGYDPVFRRARSLPDGDEQVGQYALRYLPPVTFRAQIEERTEQRGPGHGVGGDEEPGRLELTALRVEFEALGLVTPAGEVLLAAGDRLDEVRREDGTLVVGVLEAFGRPLYVERADLDGWGGLRTSNPRNGLVDVVFTTRRVTR